MTEDEAFTQAVATYAKSPAFDSKGGVRTPDRARSIIAVDPTSPTVILRDAAGVPLGTVAWFRDGSASFEPPTRLTVVDHFQSLRPSQLQANNPVLVIDTDEFEYEHDGEAMQVFRRVDGKRADLVGTIQIFSGDAFTAAPSLGPFAAYLRSGEVAELVASRAETRADGASWVVGQCSKCGQRGEVRAGDGTRTHWVLFCSGDHWVKVALTS